jgi:hypothetical protein
MTVPVNMPVATGRYREEFQDGYKARLAGKPLQSSPQKGNGSHGGHDGALGSKIGAEQRVAWCRGWTAADIALRAG